MTIEKAILIINENNLLNIRDFKSFLKDNQEFKNFINSFYSSLFKFNKNSFKQKIERIYNSYNYSLTDWKDIKNFIEEQLIDKENEVSPSKLNLLIKINPEIRNKILEFTSNYPDKFSLVGRCELIRQDIKFFPICPVCKTKHVGWSNASHLHTFCSLKCQANSLLIKERREQTMLKTHGVKNSFERKEDGTRSCETTNLKKYGVTNTGGLDFVKEKREKTLFNKMGLKHNWKVKGEERKTLQSNILKSVRQKYGVDNVSQVEELQNKIKKNSLTKLRYKETNLYYQSSYEKLFLELIEEKGLLGRVKRGPTIKYNYKNKERFYFPDFIFDDKLIIEIKSTWTYDNCGKDIEKRNINNIKWNTAKEKYNLTVLFNKEEIRNFVQCLSS